MSSLPTAGGIFARYMVPGCRSFATEQHFPPQLVEDVFREAHLILRLLNVWHELFN